MPAADSRRSAAAGVGALTGVVSYAVQRLVDLVTAPDVGPVLAQLTIPYFWRCAFALLHAILAGMLCYLAVREPDDAAAVERAVMGLVWPVLALGVLAMGIWP
jgi:hypothetical protein